MVMKGEGMVHPMSAQARSRPATSAATSSSGLVLIRPATGSSTSPRTRPSCTATAPPPQFTKAFAAMAMSSSLSPTTNRLWAS